MSLIFNMLSRLVITFLPRSKRLLISWLQSPSAVILEPRKTKSATVSTVSPSICHEVMGPDAMILVFWITVIKKTKNNKSWCGSREIETLMHCCVGMKNGVPFVEYSCMFSQKVKYRSSYSIPRHKPERNNTCSHKNLHVPVHNILFIMAQIWKQPKCLSPGK